ncbi:hypothetical protein [Streptomyces cinereospinus]|uniref:Uncharacterized protein n=1 Tax=Streptomyces cinereospinus TaxID=285561 RepID=A0ABV5N671_9ACTN
MPSAAAGDVRPVATPGTHSPRTGRKPEYGTDGTHWSWTGTWTLPKEQSLRIGLVSLNMAGATAYFDCLRAYGS